MYLGVAKFFELVDKWQVGEVAAYVAPSGYADTQWCPWFDLVADI